MYATRDTLPPLLHVVFVQPDALFCTPSADEETAVIEVRNAVAIVIRRDDGAVLSVRRPSDDPHLPDIWGLPAINMTEHESPEEAAIRAAKEKLGIAVKVKRRIGCETVSRPSFALHLTEYEVDVVGGHPQVPQADTSITQYVAARFTKDHRKFVAAARRGSACCRILLRELGIGWQTPDRPTGSVAQL
jgi:8-oxo-dGTP diphosphatase